MRVDLTLVAVAGRAVCHDRRMAARAVTITSRRLVGEPPRRPRISLFQRLFLAYALVLGVAVAVLVLAPITVSVPTAITELAVILVGFALMLLAYRVLLLRGLARSSGSQRSCGASSR